jgi:hypothetical protein
MECDPHYGNRQPGFMAARLKLDDDTTKQMFIQGGVMTMRPILTPTGAVCVLFLVGRTAPFAAPAAGEDACGETRPACARDAAANR